MIHEDTSDSPDQYFPTYKFGKDKERDIALAEYNSANCILQSEEKLFTSAVNIITLAFSILGSILIVNFEKIYERLQNFDQAQLYIALSLTNFFLAIITIMYFAQRQKEIIFAARKVIVLRRMLGLSYGKIHLVLPNWRVEGANEPFSIPTFPGWKHYNSYPIYVLSGLSGSIFYFLLNKSNSNFLSSLYVLGISIFYFFYLLLAYRRVLYDYHEHLLLSVAKILSLLLGVKLVDNFEYIIYRAKLSQIETNRIGIDLKNVRNCAVFLEDKTFYSHPGLSLRGIIRAVIGFFYDGKRSGGSTISQQLARTLYIKSSKHFLGRKIIEIFLALWIERVFNKENILSMYLSSVRFEKNIFGISEAMKFFFGEKKENPSKAEAFFLIERISNITSSFLGNKIFINMQNSLNEGILDLKDIKEILEIYDNAINLKQIKNTVGLNTQDIALRFNI